MIFIHIESILNVNEFNYNLPNYCKKNIRNLLSCHKFIVILCQIFVMTNHSTYSEIRNNICESKRGTLFFPDSFASIGSSDANL